MKPPLLSFAVAVIALSRAASAAAQESVDITMPSSITFQVSDVSQTTTDAATVIRFDNAALQPGHVLRISVRAESPQFSGPRGTIPASAISWTATNASGGFGTSGTLSASSYTEVFRSTTDPLSGSIDLQWTLGPPGTGVLASSYGLTLRWKVDSVAP